MPIAKHIQEERADQSTLSIQRAMGSERASRGRDRGEPDVTPSPAALSDAAMRRVPLTPEAQEDHAQRVAEAARLAASEGMEARRFEGGRMPFGEPELSLYHPEIEGFRLYWFNDVKDRIFRAKRAGYEHVSDHTGEAICRVVSREGPREVKAYLMKIPIEWYLQDKAAQDRRESQKIAEIKAGRYQVEPGSNQYVPSQGIHIREER